MVNEMSWHQFSTLPGMNKVPQHEVERQYRIYLNEIAEQRIAIHLIQEAAMTQAEAMAVAASNGGGGGIIQQEQGDLPSNAIELVVSAANGSSFGMSDIIVSALTTIDVDWGDGATDTYEIASDDGFSHTFDVRPEPYTIRMTFSDISLVTEFYVSNNSANVTEAIGLQNLINLTHLEIDNNALTSIDVSGMSNLISLDVSDCVIDGTSTPSLTSVNVSGCTSLETLRVDDNDFSSGFPDLSDCTALVSIDFDQCGLTGSVDISNLPALEYPDFGGNTQLTEIIISRTQPLGANANEILFGNCALTQTSVDNILLELASGSVSNGYISLNGGTNATPGEVGRESLFVLDSRGWSFTITNGNHTSLDVAYELLQTNICASTNTVNRYIVSGSAVEVGNKLYQNSEAWNPAPAGWYRIDGDGSVKFEVSGSKGEIISTAPCGV
jgi:Leucine-rich repeat (LRR) protein